MSELVKHLRGQYNISLITEYQRGRWNNMTNQQLIAELRAENEKLRSGLGIADRWFDKLLYDLDFTPLAVNDPLKPLLIDAHTKIQQALKGESKCK